MAIYVTKSYSPDYDEYCPLMEEIFKRRVFTNHGPCSTKLEKELAAYFHTPYLTLCSNATLGLQIAAHAAGLRGRKVITTPFTYVATVSALLWIGCEVIFADIDAETLCISPERISEQMNPEIAGIMPVDIYGHACDFEAIEKIARGAPQGTIPVIYDAAQTFGSLYKGKPLVDYGDYAVCSFHATKTFHTFEGGCIVTHSADMMKRMHLLTKFGHIDDNHYCLGINAKMSEAHAAMGLVMLDKVQELIEARKKLSGAYDQLIISPRIRRPKVAPEFQSNYSYYPVIFESEELLLKVTGALKREDIHARRYFYPSLTKLPYVERQVCPVCDSVAPRALCLPLYADMGMETLEKIANIVNRTLA